MERRMALQLLDTLVSISTRIYMFPYIILAHLNLHNEYLPYKQVIGQIVLDVSLHLL